MNLRQDSLEQIPECTQIVDELFCFWSNLMPDRIQLTANDCVEGPEVSVLHIEIVQIELLLRLDCRKYTGHANPHLRIGSFKFRERSHHALHNSSMDIPHGFSHRLIELDHIGAFTL